MLVFLITLLQVTSPVNLLPRSSSDSNSLKFIKFEDDFKNKPIIMEPVARIPNNASAIPFPNDVGETPRLVLKPEEYIITIFPIKPEDNTFKGSVQIHFKILETTSTFYLNMVDINLDFSSLTITKSSPKGEETTVQWHHYTLNPVDELVVFTLLSSIAPPDSLRFTTTYTGSLVNDSQGLNSIVYVDQNEQEKRVLSTYLQPNGARRLFPCIDEPSEKARFVLHVATHVSEKVLSNMPLDFIYPDDDPSYKWSAFKMTLPMSTYLVAFVISDFRSVASSPSKVARVWSRKTNLKNTTYASKLAERVLHWYENYLQVNYPLPKLDLVTFPTFTVAGMENFGLITTREKSLITNGKLSRKEWVATVTSHEIAHQWAGNLVTPRKWSEYWLSEGFATYLAAKALDELEPELEATKRMLSDDVQKIMNQDEGEINSPLVINHFESIVLQGRNLHIYYKGASVLRMLNSIFGDEMFLKSLRVFFDKNKFDSVTESDLYEVLLEISKGRSNSRENSTLPAPLHEIMKSWTLQKGYPYLYVFRKPSGEVAIKQSPNEKTTTFSASAPNNSTPLGPYWWIPVSFSKSSDPEYFSSYAYPRMWMPPSPEPLIMSEVTSKDSWTVVNIQQTLYCKVNYDHSLWKDISTQLSTDHQRIHSINRALLLEDAFYFFQKGFLDIDVPFSLIKYLGKEKNFSPLESAFKHLRNIEIVMRGTEHYELLRKFLSSLVSKMMREKFGLNHTEKKRYDLILSWACKLRTPECSQLSQGFFDEWKASNDLNKLPEKAGKDLLCVATEEGVEENWRLVYKRYLKSTDSQEKDDLSQVLTCAPNQSTILRLLNNVTDPIHNLQFDNMRKLFDDLIRSKNWAKLTWNYINNNYNKVKDRFEFFPLPFITTPYDFEQFQIIVKKYFNKISKENEENLKLVQKENKKFAQESARIISRVSDWLKKEELHLA